MEPTGYIDSRGVEIRVGDMIELNPNYNMFSSNPHRVVVTMDEAGVVNFEPFLLLSDAWTIIGNVNAEAYQELKKETL